MAESDRRNPGTSTPTRIDGAVAPPTQFSTERTADGKYRFMERLDGDASVSISRERILEEGPDGNLDIANQFGNLLVITTTGRDDTILIDQRKDGTLDINVNGKQFLLSLAATQDLAVRSGEGNDKIIATSRVTVNVDADGGAGDDVVVLPNGNNRVNGGPGRDTIWLGAGKNYVDGGPDDDVIQLGRGVSVGYGGTGNDIMYSGPGVKYMDGGEGNDLLFSGPDKSVLSGVSSKNEVVLGPKGDRVYMSDGIDPKLGSSITIVGTSAFQERVEADLNTFRSSPVGQQMLTALDLAARTKGNSVTITELTHEQNGLALKSDNDVFLKSTRSEAIPGAGANATVRFNPSFFNPPNYGGGFLPVVVLYHELSHAYNIVTGTLQPGIYLGPGIDGLAQVNNRERQAVGLRNDGSKHDFDGNPKTPKTTANPEPLTENGLRKEMDLPLRESYDALPPLRTATTSNALPAALRSTEDHLHSIANAVGTDDFAALQKGFADLLASPQGQQFRKEGTAEFESQAARLTPKDSSDVEQPAQPLKTQQNVRSR